MRPIVCLQEGWRLIREQYWLFCGITVVGMLLGQLAPFAILLGPMMCGIYLCLFRRQRGEPVTFDMLFKGFDYFRESLIAALIQVAPVFILLVFMQVAFVIGMVFLGPGMQEPSDEAVTSLAPATAVALLLAAFALMVVVMLLVTALFMFTYPLIVDRKLSGLDAVKTSFRAVAGNFGGVIGLVALQILLGVLGALLCYVGAFLFIPVGFAASAIAYQQVFPRELGV